MEIREVGAVIFLLGAIPLLLVYIGFLVYLASRELGWWIGASLITMCMGGVVILGDLLLESLR